MYNVALIDSGIGGLSILSAIQAQSPNNQYLYFADHSFAPYGDKSPQQIQERTLKITQQLNQEHALDCIIIACNTASTHSLDIIRQHINIPIIGVVPAVKTAASISVNQRIGILATPATVNGQYIDSLISEFSPNAHITKLGTIELVAMAEDKLLGRMPNTQHLKTIISPFIQQQCDTVVLGCTHFPFLKEELKAICPKVRFIDSSQAIANRCCDILSKLPYRQIPYAPQNEFYSTKFIEPQLKHALIGMGFDHMITKELI